jgi:hypothetical protein
MNAMSGLGDAFGPIMPMPKYVEDSCPIFYHLMTRDWIGKVRQSSDGHVGNLHIYIAIVVYLGIMAEIIPQEANRGCEECQKLVNQNFNWIRLDATHSTTSFRRDTGEIRLLGHSIRDVQREKKKQAVEIQESFKTMFGPRFGVEGIPASDILKGKRHTAFYEERIKEATNMAMKGGGWGSVVNHLLRIL